MKTKFGKLGILLGLLLGFAFAVAQPPGKGSSQGKTYPLAGSLFATLTQSGWSGYAFIALGGNPVKEATISVQNHSVNPRANGAIYGSETITFTFTDGSGSFQADVDFASALGSTPNMGTVHEQGVILNGTGNYALASGILTCRGHVILGKNPMPWMSELHGSISGVVD
jgi:hypothetical protein